jgi:hypothetical protein
MALPTLPGEHKKEDSLNPGQQDYDRRFTGTKSAEELKRAEDQAAFNNITDNFDQTADDSQENANINRIKERESGGDPEAASTFRSNFTGSAGKSKVRGKAWFKRAGPLAGIGGVVGLFAIVVLLLTAPSLVLVQMKEIFTSKFNTQLTSWEARSNRLLLSQVNGATKGYCSAKASLACKFTSINDKRVESLKKAGFELVDESKNSLTGRTTYNGMRFNGTEVKANNLASTLAKDPAMRNAFKVAYNPKYAGFTGKAWSAVAAKYKISKQAPDLDGGDEEKAREKMKTIAQEGMSEGGGRNAIAVGEQKDPNCTSNCATWTPEDVEAAGSTAASLDTEGKNGTSGRNVKSSLGSLQTDIIAAQGGSLVKITGVADTYCTAVGALNSLTYAAKAIRTLQLVRYMMIFSSVTDSIKGGGNPAPEDVAYLGGILTTTTANASNPSETTMGSATDSFGYKYAAYGDTSGSQSSMNIANRFMAGGGMVGQLSAVSNTIYDFFGNGDRASARQAAKNTCGVLANPVVQVGSVLIGIAALLVPGVNVGAQIAKTAAVAAVGIGISLIPSLLADMVAGTVTDGIAGEESGNAIASGYGSLLSDSLAGQNGAAPMSKEDTIAYSTIQEETTNQYIADELQNTSPLDASNPHTFVGSIAASLIPLQSKSNPLSSVASLVGTSLKSLIPTTKAQSTENTSKSLEICQDPDAIDGGYAVDPFCNVIRGIPPQYLNRDPVDVTNALISSGDINDDGVPQQKYADFIKQCMTSDQPMGYTDTTFSPDQAKNCVIDSENANYYLNYMDQRIELGMSGLDVEEATSAPAETTDKVALAQKILAKNKVQYFGGVKPTIQNIADGTYDPNSEPCGINLNILRMIDVISDSHSITISDVNRHCTGVMFASGKASRHYAGNGSAIDIAVIDGKATNGRDAGAISVINLVMPILSEAATSAGSYSQFGQANCGPNPTPTLGANVRSIKDTCNHLHLDVPAKSDASLKYDPSGF